ncbi:unnamed protein product [Cuscuta epithymum]|uniref:Poly [ADP-ribose] polymerase n=1 Tax=Cuscuta epithymum TaxID=186058 RepID=A0AAV0FXE9_9ASTE|nr:unnamed protein product [Cuscuta epithymum]
MQQQLQESMSLLPAMESRSNLCSDAEQEVVSDCESVVSDTSTTFHEEMKDFDTELIRVGEDERIHSLIRQKLLAGGLGDHNTSIEAVRRNAFPSSTKKAKLQAFEIFAKAAEESGGDGNANVRYAWFGASVEHINTILSHGFLPSMIKNGDHGYGIYLSPDQFPLGSVKSAVADENGVRHILLCRVILGKTEEVPRGSRQWYPTTQEFVSGVDDSASPTNYIVWSTHMNTHILPLYLISFRVSSSTSGERTDAAEFPFRKPTSPWISFPALLSALAKYLPPHTMRLISEQHKNYRERKISRHEMIQRMRRLAGDERLAAIIKAHRPNNSHSETTMFSCIPSRFQKTKSKE